VRGGHQEGRRRAIEGKGECWDENKWGTVRKYQDVHLLFFFSSPKAASFPW